MTTIQILQADRLLNRKVKHLLITHRVIQLAFIARAIEVLHSPVTDSQKLKQRQNVCLRNICDVPTVNGWLLHYAQRCVVRWPSG